MVNDYHSPISQVEEKKKQYTAYDVNRAYHERRFHHINDQSVKQILHAFYKKILQNIPIMQKDSRMDEYIYESSVPHF